MALKSQPIVEDVSSDEVEELRKQFNLLLEQLDALTGLSTVQDLQTAVQTNVKKVTVTKQRPNPRKFPVVG